MLVTSLDMQEINNLKYELSNNFVMKDVGATKNEDYKRQGSRDFSTVTSRIH